MRRLKPTELGAGVWALLPPLGAALALGAAAALGQVPPEDEARAQLAGRVNEPGRLPWQRLLQGEQARQIAAQERQLAQLQETGNFADALPLAEALAKRRSDLQGAEHWQAITARWEVEAIRRALRQGDDTRAAFARSYALERQGKALRDRGRYQESLLRMEKILAIRRQVLGEEHPLTAKSYGEVALNLNAQGKYKEAARPFGKALAIRRQTLGEEHPNTAVSYNNVANNLAAQGKHRQAEAGYAKALALWRRVLGETHPLTALGYGNVAYNLHAQGRYAEAAAGYARALDLRRQALGEEHPDTARSYDNVASNLYAQGKYDEATAGYARALAIRRKVLGEEHRDTAQSYNNVASNLNAQGRYVEASAGLGKALAIFRKLLGEEHPDTALAYNNVAVNLDAQGKYAEAAALYARALAIRRQALGEEHPDTAFSYNSVAVNLDAQGKFAEAAIYYRKALAIRRQLLGEEHPDTARSYNNLAANLDAQGKVTEAAEALRKALAICRKVLGEEHPGTAASYNNLAVNLYVQGKYGEAAEGYARALAIRRQALGEEHPDTARSYNNLAANLNAQGKYAAAEALWLVAADRFARARLRIAASGLDRATKTGEASRLLPLAGVLARNGKPEAAWQRFEESLARGTWDDLSARLRRPAAEQARQAEFSARLNRLDQLIEKTVAVQDPTPEQKKRRDDLLTERRKLQDEFDVFARHLERNYGPAAGQVFARERIQAALPADTALVGWLDVAGQPQAADPDGEHWAVLLRATGVPRLVRLRGSGPAGAWTAADTRLPADLRALLHTPRGNWQGLARRLRQQRLEPLAPHLAAGDGRPAVRHLVVLPATALAGVPVEVFADGYTVSYALSGTLHAHLRKLPSLSTQGLLALADPVFDQGTRAGAPAPSSPRGADEKWPALPGTRAEVEALRRLFDGPPTPKLLVDSAASEQELFELARSGALGQYRYLHLATHGEVDDRFPLRSALILARDHLPDPVKQLNAGLPIYDGRLTAEKVLRQWHLHSELVTLSACQTALGKYERGEGFVGFAQALLLAGSRAVVLSQWKVDDAATALLMDRFYQNLLGKRADLKRPLSKAAALAEAKAWLRTLSRDEAVQRTAQLRQGVARGKGRPALPLLPAVPAAPAEARAAPPYAHPYYWAAFVLIGDPE